ncbi:MAG: hypothetical protein AAGK21_14345 [Bacteroidota bacterium]
MDDAVTRLDYEAAEEHAREALVRYDEFSPDQLVEVHSTLGTLLHGRGEVIASRVQFVAALSLDPTMALDPVFVPPQTVEFFEEVRQEVQAPTPAVTDAPEVRYVILEDRRPGAVRRSLVAPGWGQFYKGDRTRGWIYGTAATAALAGVVGSAIQVGIEGDQYREAPANQVDDEYAEYNRWWKARRAFAVTTAAIWSVAALDALLTGGPEAPSQPGQIQVAPATAGAGLQLRVGL